MIVNYLIEKGYKPFRWSRNRLTPCDRPIEFSSVTVGGVDVRLIKGNSVFIYGLHEKGKPPTLIYPRPKGIYLDDEMNRFLSENTDEEVFKKLLPCSYTDSYS
jgi:hypothetical protein